LPTTAREHVEKYCFEGRNTHFVNLYRKLRKKVYRDFCGAMYVDKGRHPDKLKTYNRYFGENFRLEILNRNFNANLRKFRFVAITNFFKLFYSPTVMYRKLKVKRAIVNKPSKKKSVWGKNLFLAAWHFVNKYWASPYKSEK
jgi:hypothetical protein